MTMAGEGNESDRIRDMVGSAVGNHMNRLPEMISQAIKEQLSPVLEKFNASQPQQGMPTRMPQQMPQDGMMQGRQAQLQQSFTREQVEQLIQQREIARDVYEGLAEANPDMDRSDLRDLAGDIIDAAAKGGMTVADVMKRNADAYPEIKNFMVNQFENGLKRFKPAEAAIPEVNGELGQTAPAPSGKAPVKVKPAPDDTPGGASVTPNHPATDNEPSALEADENTLDEAIAKLDG